MPTKNQPQALLEITPAIPIPPHLTDEIQSKLAYVDEWIAQAEVSEQHILLRGSAENELTPERQTLLEEKVQRVVHSMARGSIKPKIQVLEDHLDRPVFYDQDPMHELLARQEVSPEIQGVFSLGPLLSQLIEFFESQFLELANSFQAQPYRFPALIPAKYLERVNYFSRLPPFVNFCYPFAGRPGCD